MPAIDDQGRILMEDKDRIFLSPDGHGGMLAALAGSRCLRDAQRRGIEHFFYFQVDNPLVRLCDRELVGYHLLADSEMSTQVVAKQSPDDKVGNVVSVDGHLRVIEYSDLPPDAGQQHHADGSLRFWAGSIAIHAFSVAFLERCVRSDESLPFHRARKKVSYVDRHGNPVVPEQPNATKFERFIFDLMPLAENAIVVEADEREVFAPLKNASGAEKDTPEACQQAIVDRSRRWLESVGAVVEPAAMIEIDPKFALDRDELSRRVSPGASFRGSVYLRTTQRV
jgi:UDP-N-acetylglucosamine/UDP-N-acetylgalactosamine diphosphorylase